MRKIQILYPPVWTKKTNKHGFYKPCGLRFGTPRWWHVRRRLREAGSGGTGPVASPCVRPRAADAPEAAGAGPHVCSDGSWQ